MADTLNDTVDDAIPTEVQGALQGLERLSFAFGRAIIRCQDPEACGYLMKSSRTFNLAVEQAGRRGNSLLDDPTIFTATLSAIMFPLTSEATNARLRDSFSEAVFGEVLTVIEEVKPAQCLQTLRAFSGRPGA